MKMKLHKLFWIIYLSYVTASTARHTDCEITPRVQYATYRVDDDDETVTAVYTCENGYELKGESKIVCDLDTDEWLQEPPVCEKSESDDDEIEEETEQSVFKKKLHEIQEDRYVTREFALRLDMSCVQARAKAPIIDNGQVVKYDRRKKGGQLFLVAFYKCNDNYDFEDPEITAVYCSRKNWIGELPNCVSANADDYGDNDGDDYDEGDDEENGGNGNGNGHQNGRESHRHQTDIKQHENEKENVEENENKMEIHHTTQHQTATSDTDFIIPHNPVTENLEGKIREYEKQNFDEYMKNENIPENIIEEEPAIFNETCDEYRGGCDHNCIMIPTGNPEQPAKPLCSCYQGFYLDPETNQRCFDYNECEINNGRCEQICINLPGSFQCSCESGLQIDTLTGNTCIDINECQLRNGHGPCQDTCHNIFGSYKCSCENLPGTKLSSDNHTCEDAGECNNNNGGCSHKCLTILGRVYCLCPDGFDLSDDWKTCKDINECENEEIASRCEHGCENLHGSYKCLEPEYRESPIATTIPLNELEREANTENYVTQVKEQTNELEENNAIDKSVECDGGYRKNNANQCIDIDECAEGTSECEHCENVLGGFECVCPSGYELSEDERTCQDINECEMYSDDEEQQNTESYKICSHDCVNLIGSFQCQCPANYHMHIDQRTCIRDYCEDLRNPALNKVQCSHECIDDPDNGFICKCPFGFILDSSDMKTCLKMDSHDNSIESRRDNDFESHRSNFEYSNIVEKQPERDEHEEEEEKQEEEEEHEIIDLTKTQLIDRCTELHGHHSCYPGQCINDLSTYQGFRCECSHGYIQKEGRCHDIDECSTGEHKCSHYCQNNDGSYQCSCPSGLVLSPDDDYKSCIDVNECQENFEICGHDANLICENTHGSYKCLCPEGSQIQANGECKDIILKAVNPCENNNGGCSHICRYEEQRVSSSAVEYNIWCECPEGMVIDEKDRNKCVKKNICDDNNGGCSQNCDPNGSQGEHCTCNLGYILADDKKTCVDVNECNDENGGCAHLCSNLIGSFECLCKPGFEMLKQSNLTNSCVDIDECALNLDKCKQTNSICINTEGAYYCECPKGLKLNETQNKCIDIDECDINNGNCSHICINLVGGYQCSCPIGQILIDDEKTCDYVDECKISNGGCSHDCHYSLGEVTCLCPKGYQLDSSRKNCVDIDECSVKLGPCSHDCINTIGSFQCSCPIGFNLDKNGLNCRDVNECIDNNGNCSHICVNLLGSFKCVCELGFMLQDDQQSCHDLDECAENYHDCSHICMNIPGGYECGCPSGYELSIHSKFICEDVNECLLTNNGGCSHNCVNLEGSYNCECPDTYLLGVDNKTCLQIDECQLAGAKCSHGCENIKGGGFICLCPYGMKLSEDKFTCIDIDECTEIENNGGCSHLCENTHGSYKCNCHSGYILGDDNKTCYDIDECLDGNGGCNQYCLNYGGGYKCQCAKSYVLAYDNKTCEFQNYCSENNGGCSQICQSTSDGPVCACREGFILSNINNSTCFDIDECEYQNTCQQECRNTIGSFECVCRPGYTKDSLDQCVDVNECDFMNGGCSRDANCINIPGSFRCRCNNGFKLAHDERTCFQIKDFCKPLKAPKNGDIHCTRSRHKTQLYYKTKCSMWCKTGFRLEGSSLRYCNGTGEWDGIETLCLSHACPSFPKPKYGIILPSNCISGHIFPGQRCLLQCPPGYAPVGKRAAICNANKKWSTNSVLECIPSHSSSSSSSSSTVTTTSGGSAGVSVPSSENGNSVIISAGGSSSGSGAPLGIGGSPSGGVGSDSGSSSSVTLISSSAGGHGSSAGAHGSSALGHGSSGGVHAPSAGGHGSSGGSSSSVIVTGGSSSSGIGSAGGSSGSSTITITGTDSNIQPYIRCPQDTTLLLPEEQKTIFIRLQQPETNVDYYRYVDSHPEWAKNLDAHLQAGVHILRFRARNPNTNAYAICRTVITVKESHPPKLIYCPPSYEIQLNPNENVRSIKWKEPVFEGNTHLKQIYKSKTPGELFGPGLHNILYVATDRDGQSSRCEFKLIVRASQKPSVVGLTTQQMYQSTGKARGILTGGGTFQTTGLLNHESYLICPGKPAIKIETNYPVQVPVNCYMKNIRISTTQQQQQQQQQLDLHHRRRHQRHYFNNVLSHQYPVYNYRPSNLENNRLSYLNRWN